MDSDRDDVLERLKERQREKTIAKQRVSEIEALMSDARRRKLTIYDRDHILTEKQRLVVRLAELRRLIREDELLIGRLDRQRVADQIPGSTMTAQLRALMDRARKWDHVYVAACAFTDDPSEKHQRHLASAVKNAREGAVRG